MDEVLKHKIVNAISDVLHEENGSLGDAVEKAFATLKENGYTVVYDNVNTRGRVISSHVSWGPDADKLTAEERAEIVKSIENPPPKETVLVPVDQLEAIAVALSQLTRLGQARIEEWEAMPKAEAALRHEIFGLAEMPTVFATQWLPKEVRARLWEEKKKWQ